MTIIERMETRMKADRGASYVVVDKEDLSGLLECLVAQHAWIKLKDTGGHDQTMRYVMQTAEKKVGLIK